MRPGRKVVLHLHNYRLVCAVGTCADPDGEDCTRCHGADTLPGAAAQLPRQPHRGAPSTPRRWRCTRRRMVEHADAVVVPSAFALERLRTLGAPVEHAHVRAARDALVRRRRRSADQGTYALIAARLVRGRASTSPSPRAARPGCARRRRRRAAAHPAAAGACATVGRVDGEELARLRAGAGLELAPSRMAESFGLSAAEAMAAGVPVVGSRIGALTELLPDDALVAPGDATGARCRRRAACSATAMPATAGIAARPRADRAGGRRTDAARGSTTRFAAALSAAAAVRSARVSG